MRVITRRFIRGAHRRGLPVLLLDCAGLLDLGEGLARWASNGTQGSEFTGLYFDPFDSGRAWVNIQHPTSGNDRTIMIAVPEPTSIGLLAAGSLLALRRRRA
jgi:secreted PhoX family phosphatase